MIQVTTIRHELRERLEEIYGDRLSRLVLYGSHARGQAHEESDIDVLIVLRSSGRRRDRRLAEVAVDMLAAFGELVSLTPISEEEFGTGDTPFLRNVREEGVPL